MNDHDLTPTTELDPNRLEPAVGHSSTFVTAATAVATDRPSALVAEILAIEPERTTRILRALGGVAGLAYGTEAALVAAGIPRKRARLLRASFELARLAVAGRPEVGRRLAGAWDVWSHMRTRLSGLPVEEFWMIGLDVRHRVLLDEMAARGSLSGVEIHPRDVFRQLLRAGAAAVIFVHNHPSGNPEPSRADIELTGRLREVGETCGIQVLDHVVVGADGFVSLVERSWR
jgi:DNA repair protein RadC